ncbi:MAG: iron ABC transporter permease [Gammaproteobacteria bacterium]|nr:MAG: iron ABC transporter permease [Gammaproteobacteria bacterium]
MSAWLNVNVQYWRVASLVLATMIAIPIVVVFSAWLTPADDVWQHLARTILPELVRNTLVLVLGVCAGVLLLGVGLAWLTAMCEFPGRKIFEWALMLPLAVPAYVLAFVLVGLLDFSGPVASAWREVFGRQAWFPEVRSTWGVITVMVLAFYPYVYMLARTAFQNQGRSLLDSGRVLGLGPWSAFFHVALPMARPAIAAGAALAVMEALADFGAVSVFNYDTFTTAIYKSWLGLFNLNAAAQLASLLLLFVLVAVFSERRLRKRARFDAQHKGAHKDRFCLGKGHAWMATGVASLVLAIAFIIPVGQLIVWAASVIVEDLDARYLGFFFNTIFLGASSALLVALGALVLAYSYRLRPDMLTKVAVRISTVGYALPGSVLAVGIMLSIVWLDEQLILAVQSLFGVEIQQILAGTVLVLILAYIVRFLAVAYGPVDAAFERIRPSILQAARSLGCSNWQILWRVSMPMLRGGILSAMLLVFVEVMKEMPATLLLRPFGWDTLATRIFEMTSEGQWQHAALPAVTLILVGLVPVVMLVRRSSEH